MVTPSANVMSKSRINELIKFARFKYDYNKKILKRVVEGFE